MRQTKQLRESRPSQKLISSRRGHIDASCRLRVRSMSECALLKRLNWLASHLREFANTVSESCGARPQFDHSIAAARLQGQCPSSSVTVLGSAPRQGYWNRFSKIRGTVPHLLARWHWWTLMRTLLGLTGVSVIMTGEQGQSLSPRRRHGSTNNSSPGVSMRSSRGMR